MNTTKKPNTLTKPKALYDVEVFSGQTRLGVITVNAESPEDASNEAIKDIHVKIRRNYQ